MHHVRGKQQAEQHHGRGRDTLQTEPLVVAGPQSQILGDEDQPVGHGQQVERPERQREKADHHQHIGDGEQPDLQQGKDQVAGQIGLLQLGQQQLRGKGGKLGTDQHQTVAEGIEPDRSHVELVRQ